MIRRIRLGAASAAALVAMVPVAHAADLPAYEPAPAVAAPLPSFSWSGPYVGLQAGYSWGAASNGNPDGIVYGAYLGYNVQLDNSPVVLGIETDFNFADINGRVRGGRGGRTGTDWNGSVRARAGYAFDRFLVYGAGGLAYADRKVSINGRDKDDNTALGWTVGGGVEYAATDNVAIRADYRYADYGSDRYNGVRSSYSEHRVMGGVAFKFNSPF